MRKAAHAILILVLFGQMTLLAGAIPPPESVLGFKPGADNKLATYDQSVTYFRKLAAAAPKNMVIHEAGKTSQGRTYIYALISSAENLYWLRPCSRSTSRAMPRQ